MSESGIVNIRGKKYKTVAKRVADFRSRYPDWSIETDVIDAGEQVLVKCIIRDGSGKVLSTGHAEEERGSSNINKTSAIENAETSAIGRALAFCAEGLAGEEIASADEVANAVNQQTQKEIYGRAAQFMTALKDNFDTVMAIENNLYDPTPENISLAQEAWSELTEEVQMALWLAPSKGGWLSTEHRKLLKEGS
tara:strand:- start:203 stop:784 length:582 start_codon:yes stop_codon:yes gene_type:complete